MINIEKNIGTLGVLDGMKVVDIGAGSGFYTIECAKKVGYNGMVYAVDVQKDLIDKVKNSGRLIGLNNIQSVWGNAEKLGGTKLRDAIADRVILSNVLFQIAEKDRDNLALEIKRLLKPKGKLMLIDWSSQSPLSPKTLVGEIMAEAIFTKAGFKVLETFDAGDYHYGIIFERQ